MPMLPVPGDLAGALPAVYELLLPGAGEGALESGFVGIDMAVFEGEFEFQSVAFGEGVLDFGGPLQRAVGSRADRGVGLEFAALDAERADQIEDDGFRNAGFDAGRRAFVGILGQ